jgi:hypothetical protein
MNTIYKFFFGLMLVLTLGSCNNDDNSSTVKRNYAEQYEKDLDSIEEFLQTHYMEIDDNPGADDDQDVTFTEIPTGGTQVSVWNQTEFPLEFRNVEQNDITYKVYYIKFRNGVGEKPCNVDGVYANYKGELLNGTVFDQTTNPQTLLSLESVIRGWSEIFPQFATGTYTSNNDGTISYGDFGAGVMFLPSGLGYYNIAQSTIPAYSPLIFSIKLFELERFDQDSDGIPSYLEDLDGDRYIYLLEEDVVNPDDTDGDGFPDYLDLDDDGDLVLTRTERIQYIDPVTEEKFYYSYNGASVDDPLTPYDETQGIPSCGTTPDYTSPTRLRRYLDSTCN